MSAGPAIRIRTATPGDADAIAAIYAPYVAATPITFELDAPDAGEMIRRMAEARARFPWLVAADDGGAILGYAYAGPFNPRAAYRWMVTTGIYLAMDHCGRGIGGTLYAALLRLLEAQGIAAATGLVTLPNAASVTLHERLGFAHVGTFRQAGYKLGRWHDVGYWQLQLAPRGDSPAEPLPPAIL